MSSEISTEGLRLEPDATPARKPETLHPWQFFVLAALACATAVTFVVRGQGFTVIILLLIIMATTALVGLGVLRSIRPLLGAANDRQMPLGERTRAALEQEKALALRTIKELEFDRAMGKLSDTDFQEMSVRLRARAARLIRRLDAGDGYRSQIEREVARRMGDVTTSGNTATCVSCLTVNERDARFCKQCGSRL